MEKYIIIQKKQLFAIFIYMFFVEFQLIICDLESDLIWPWLHANILRHSPSQCVYLSVFPFVWLFLYDVIAMFARALNEFVELLKTKSFRCHYKAYYTNHHLIMIARMYLVFLEGAKINTIS